jgi:hypothetical protein
LAADGGYVSGVTAQTEPYRSSRIKMLNAYAFCALFLAACRGLRRSTYLPWRRILLAILIVPQLANGFPALYGTRRFITVFATARHFSALSQINPGHANPVYVAFILSLFFHLRHVFHAVSFILVFSAKLYMYFASSAYLLHVRPISSVLFDHPNNILLGLQIMKLPSTPFS